MGAIKCPKRYEGREGEHPSQEGRRCDCGRRRKKTGFVEEFEKEVPEAG